MYILELSGQGPLEYSYAVPSVSRWRICGPVWLRDLPRLPQLIGGISETGFHLQFLNSDTQKSYQFTLYQEPDLDFK